MSFQWAFNRLTFALLTVVEAILQSYAKRYFLRNCSLVNDDCVVLEMMIDGESRVPVERCKRVLLNTVDSQSKIRGLDF